jgi:MFS family permease
VGALFFGQLTDRFGRKKLFIVTLGLYIVATLATAFAFAPWYFFRSGSSPAPGSAANTRRSTQPSTNSSPRATGARST